MRYLVAGILCVATMISTSMTAASRENFAIQLNERDREYRNTGMITIGPRIPSCDLARRARVRA